MRNEPIVGFMSTVTLSRRRFFPGVFPLYAVLKFSGVVEEQEGGQKGVGVYSGVEEEPQNSSLRDWLT